MTVQLHQSKRELMENQLIDFFMSEHRDIADLDYLIDTAVFVMDQDDQQLLETFVMFFGDKDL